MALELFTPQESRPAPKVQAPDPYEVARSAYANQKERLIETQRMLMEELEGRSVQPAEKLMAFSQAMLTPGRTGSFGEAFGGAMGNLQKLQSEDAARAQAIAKMRMEMGMQQLGMRKEDMEAAREASIENTIKNLYTFRKGPFGEDIPTLDPSAATKLSSLTRDPALAQKMIADQRAQKIQDAISNAFVPKQDESGKVTYQFDPSSVTKILGSGGSFQDIANIAKAIPDLRRAGMLGGASVEGTPFDAIAMMAPSPELKVHAERLQKQYKAGAFKDDESAEKAAQQLLQLMTSHMDRQQNMLFQQGMQGLMMGLRQESAARAQETAEDKKIKQAWEAKQSFDSAQNVINQVDLIKNHPGRASGIWQAARPTQIVPGTDAYNFNAQIEVLKSQSFLASVQQMRGLGALSNAEGQKITDSIAKLDPRMSKEQFESSLNTIVSVMNLAKERARGIFEGKKPKLEEQNKKTIIRTGEVLRGPNKGKTVVEYSDGSREYK